jgi:hypothetical protein
VLLVQIFNDPVRLVPVKILPQVSVGAVSLEVPSDICQTSPGIPSDIDDEPGERASGYMMPEGKLSDPAESVDPQFHGDLFSSLKLTFSFFCMIGHDDPSLNRIGYKENFKFIPKLPGFESLKF